MVQKTVKKEFEIELIGEKTIKVEHGQTILDAALKAGIPLFHACGGNAECSTCRFLVVDGMECLSPINEKEAKLREMVPFPPRIRLACQTCVQNDPVRIQRIAFENTGVSGFIKDEIKDAHQKLGEKKQLVLFFLDIRNFTPFVEAFLPYDVIHVMRACYIIINEIVKINNGQIIDTSGDGFYAVFGLQSNLTEASDASIKAGRAILKELKKFNETYLEPYFGTRFEIGIGIHCGQVIVGEVLIGQKSHLSVMGRAVNIAARIQASTRKLNNNFIASEDLMLNSTSKELGEKRLIKLRGINGVFHVQLIGDPFTDVIN